MSTLRFTVIVHESKRCGGRYRYGLIKIENSDLLPYVGKKVQVIIVPEEINEQTQS